MIRHPALELVGVLVYDAAKDGIDAGELCGEGATGVEATTDPAVIHALNADCVLYMPRALVIDDVVALLEAGTNVVTTRGELFAGGVRLAGDDRARVLDACMRGKQLGLRDREQPRVHHGCASPRAAFDAAARRAGADRRIRQPVAPRLAAPAVRADGFRPRARHLRRARRSSFLLGEFAPPLELLAEAAGRPVDAWTCTGEVAAARVTTALVAGELPAGTIAAQRTVFVGKSGADEIVRFTANWYCTTDIEPAWDVRPTGWRVRVHGDAPFDVDLPFPVPLDELGAYTPAYTANRPVNAVAYVCDAPPGILVTADLPPITPAGPRVQ